MWRVPKRGRRNRRVEPWSKISFARIRTDERTSERAYKDIVCTVDTDRHDTRNVRNMGIIENHLPSSSRGRLTPLPPSDSRLVYIYKQGRRPTTNKTKLRSPRLIPCSIKVGVLKTLDAAGRASARLAY